MLIRHSPSHLLLRVTKWQASKGESVSEIHYGRAESLGCQRKRIALDHLEHPNKVHNLLQTRRSILEGSVAPFVCLVADWIILPSSQSYATGCMPRGSVGNTHSALSDWHGGCLLLSIFPTEGTCKCKFRGILTDCGFPTKISLATACARLASCSTKEHLGRWSQMALRSAQTDMNSLPSRI